MTTNEQMFIDEEKQQEILQKYQKDENYRQFDLKFWIYLVSGAAIFLSIFHLYTAGFGALMAIKQRSLHLGIILFMTYLLYPANRKSAKDKPTFLDITFAVLSLISCGYLVFYYEKIAIRFGMANNTDIILGTILMLMVLEAARRTMGWILPGLSISFFLYGMFGNYIPGLMGHNGFTYQRMIEQMYIGTEGIFSIALGVSATFMILFLLFGALMGESGMGSLINDASLAMAGTTPGGPAKVAVLGSSIMATINGAAVANVVTTGAFTIPLMKRIGYKAQFAAAVEAAASCGGQIMPPVMGAAAFVMAEMTGTPYVDVMLAAIIPALLYYLGVWAMVDREARRLKLVGMKKSEIPIFKEVIKTRGHMIIPIIVIVVILLFGFSPMMGAFWGILSTIVVSSLRKETRMSPKQILKAFIAGGRTAISVAVACATVGFIIGTASLTSLGVVLTGSILSLTDGMLLPTLLLTMLSCVVLGMGLPTTPAYIMAGTIAVPALIALNVDMLAANMFVFYFAILSTLTPPVAIAAYAAAGLAGSSVFSTGWAALRLALAGFIIPFMFVYEPALLLGRAPLMDTVIVTATAIIGVIILAAAVIGYFRILCSKLEQVVLIIAALSLIVPGFYSDIIGFAVALVIYILQRRRQSKDSGLDTVGISS